MAFPEYASHDGLGLAELVRKGEVTAAELVEEAIARIERHNPTLNAVIFEMYERARQVASGPPAGGRGAPFQGVPFLLKDILGDHEGVPTTSATKILQGVPAAQDAELTRRFKKAGLIPLGKTNVPEIGTMPTTEPHLYGPARNPWNPDHSTGGSSGGSAAAVAAGIVPIAHANDGGGSIRIPASCCGLVGMKPTRARNPMGPLFGDMYGGLIMEHVVTRTVRDSAAVLDCTAGPDVGDPYWAPPVERSFLEEVSREPGRLRIACWPRNVDGAPIHDECEAAVRRTVDLLADLGHHVEEASLPVDAEAISAPFMAVWGAGAVATLDSIALATGRELKAEDFEPLTWSLYEQGRSVSGAQYMMALTAAAALASHRRVLQGLRRLGHADAGEAPGEDRRLGHAQELRGDLVDPDRLHPVHAGIQRDRPTGGLAPAALERGRTSHRGPVRRPLRRRGPALPPRRAAREGQALDRSQAADLGLTRRPARGAKR
jgi:amidase